MILFLILNFLGSLYQLFISVSLISHYFNRVKNFNKKPISLLRDARKRFLFSNNEIYFLSLNLLLESNFSKIMLRNSLSLMGSLILNHSLSTVINKCLFTGRSNSIYGQFRASRITFRKLADFGLLVGVKRSS